MVKKTSGGFRLVVDLRIINQCFNPPVVSFESLSELKACPTSVLFGCSIDIADAYHHLRLKPYLSKFF